MGCLTLAVIWNCLKLVLIPFLVIIYFLGEKGKRKTLLGFWYVLKNSSVAGVHWDQSPFIYISLTLGFRLRVYLLPGVLIILAASFSAGVCRENLYLSDFSPLSYLCAFTQVVLSTLSITLSWCSLPNSDVMASRKMISYTRQLCAGVPEEETGQREV